MENNIAGVFAAVPTAFTDDAGLELSLFMEHCDWVIDQGCDGLNVLGSTGEANSQSREARVALMRAVAESSLKRVSLMVGTGTPSLAETIELTTLAADLKFDAALVLPPYYYSGVSDDGLFAYFARLVDSVKDHDIRLYLYNFPQMTGLKFSQDLVARLVEAFPGKICGMKDSSGDLEYARLFAATFAGHFRVFPGSEGSLPDAAEHGYAGCISASVNATAAKAARIWRTRAKADRDEAVELRELRDAIASVPIVAAVKELLAIRTGRDEWRRILPPLMKLNSAERRTIEKVAERLEL